MTNNYGLVIISHTDESYSITSSPFLIHNEKVRKELNKDDSSSMQIDITSNSTIFSNDMLVQLSNSKEF